MASEQQVRKLHQKLSSLEQINPENAGKPKLTQFYDLLRKAQNSYSEEAQNSQAKFKEIAETVKKLEARCRDQADEVEKKCTLINMQRKYPNSDSQGWKKSLPGPYKKWSRYFLYHSGTQRHRKED